MTAETNPELDRQREAVFAEVGRNVVLFQDIERMLKIVLNHGQVTFTASQLKEWNGQTPTPYSKRMLGELIEPLIQNHLTPGEPEGQALAKDIEIVIRTGFTVDLKEEERAAFRIRLEDMVRQRNEFIHHLLDWLRLETMEDCQSAIDRLSHQRENLKPLYHDIRNILKVFLETWDEMPRVIEAMRAEETLRRANQS
ncbi:hypothetical protein ESB00_18385 [Oleiharenicola lentus]|uniref:Uncharacterized protein n=1 Tax=Oleiharenicola lentus TaxID=2508720 RepID=A0A4Q1C5E2_9BACT|nr:hypothetical protein [Oleiharenicola lentus]RXK53657.1 hypothetical protein ESB00_18385 [Oleiharenicola lentus]